MASPFKIFRKNQKLWIAGLTILAMFGFVFLPTILQIMGGHTSKDPVACTSKYGDLRESELHYSREIHLRVIQVLTDTLQRLGYPPVQIKAELENMLGGSTIENVADSWLLAQRQRDGDRRQR